MNHRPNKLGEWYTHNWIYIRELRTLKSSMEMWSLIDRHKFFDTSPFKIKGLVPFLLHEDWTEWPNSNEQITAKCPQPKARFTISSLSSLLDQLLWEKPVAVCQRKPRAAGRNAPSTAMSEPYWSEFSSPSQPFRWLQPWAASGLHTVRCLWARTTQ